MTTTQITVHGVLAGAYKGGRMSLKATLTHASADQGSTALCGKVKADSLCDLEMEEPPTCPACARKMAKAAG
jgi:hypothetical protein